VHFISAVCENMVSASATHPGDVHVSAAGISVEVNDTDAEGRLTLADALWYAQEQAGAQVSTAAAAVWLVCAGGLVCCQQQLQRQRQQQASVTEQDCSRLQDCMLICAPGAFTWD
jgi:leucyl aminopeptidase